MTNLSQDNCYESTLNLVKTFVESNQRKRLKLLNDIESKKIKPEKLKSYIRENLSVKSAVKQILKTLKE